MSTCSVKRQYSNGLVTTRELLAPFGRTDFAQLNQNLGARGKGIIRGDGAMAKRLIRAREGIGAIATRASVFQFTSNQEDKPRVGRIETG